MDKTYKKLSTIIGRNCKRKKRIEKKFVSGKLRSDITKTLECIKSCNKTSKKGRVNGFNQT